MDVNNGEKKVQPGDNVAEHHTSKESSLVCKVCKQVFKHYSSHSRHQSTCGQEKPFHCNRCAKPFRRKDSLNRHMESCQQKVLKTFQCYMCGKEFNDNWQLQRHLRKKRSCSIIRSIESPDFVQNYEEHRALANHVTAPYLSPEMVIPELVAQSADRNETLQSHQSTSGQKKPFHCYRCAKPFRRKDSLNRHMESCQHKVLKTFQCSMCGKEFNDNWQLQRHFKKKRSCSIVRSIESPDCVKNFEEHGAPANHPYSSIEMVVPELILQFSGRDGVLQCCTFGSDKDNLELVAPNSERDLRLQSSISVSEEVSTELDVSSMCRSDRHGGISGSVGANPGSIVPSVDRNSTVLCKVISASDEASPEWAIPFSKGEGRLKCTGISGLDFGGQEHEESLITNARNADLDCNASLKQEPMNDLSCDVHDDRTISCNNESTDCIRREISVREKESSFVCDICQQTFKHHSSYSRHRSTCGQEKPFYCNQCAKAFKRKDSLNRHVVSCQRKVMKTLQCSFCGKEFQKNWLLQRHLKTCSEKTHRVQPDNNVEFTTINKIESRRHNDQCQGQGISDEAENTFVSMVHLNCAVEVKTELVD